ncbi:MAG: ABC transporter permease subunit [Spartobacteria bacterium]|nr:ABC transporter permease subunit [Spartobacteria bacterium]
MEPKQIRWNQVKHHWEIYLFIIPTLITIALFIYYPAASGIFHSFFRWNGADISEPLGLANYKDLLFSSEFWRSFRNAFILGFWNIIKMVPPLFVAVAIHRCKSDRLQYFYRLLFVIPMVIPPLIVALIWRSFFFEATNGYLNGAIAALHLKGFLNFIAPYVGWGDVFAGQEPAAWLGDPRLIMTACIIWGFPWISSLAVLTHLAKLQSISKDVYEAGDMDGVTWLSKFTHIELPLITGSIYIMLVFVIIGTLTDAGMIIALAGMEGGPGGNVDVPALFMLRKAFIDQKMGYACAVGIVLMLMVMSLQKISTLVSEWSEYNPDTRRRIRLCFLVSGMVLNGLAPFAALWGQSMDLSLLDVVAHSTSQWFPVWLSSWGVGGYAMEFPQLIRLISFGCLLVAIPWGMILRRRSVPQRSAESREPSCLSGERTKSDIRLDNQILKLNNPRQRRVRKYRAGVLIFLRHAYIWFVLAFAFFPLYLMMVVSFKTNAQFYQAPSTLTAPFHPENWAAAWEQITPTLANSVFLSISSTLLMLFFALSAAYFFARLRMPFSRFLWNAILILMMLPMIANLVPLFRLMRDMNLLNTLTALILIGAAQGQIFGIFMLRNFIADIPMDLYEAAEMDGASHFRQMSMIVLPLAGPILGTVGVMHFMTAWNEFVLPLIMMRDHARLPVMVQLIRMAGEYIKLWGPLMAGYAMAAVPVILLFAFSMKLFVRGMTDGSVKG